MWWKLKVWQKHYLHEIRFVIVPISLDHILNENLSVFLKSGTNIHNMMYLWCKLWKTSIFWFVNRLVQAKDMWKDLREKVTQLYKTIEG